MSFKINTDDDSELMYLISENNEEANNIIFKKYSSVIDLYAKKYLNLVDGKGMDYNDLYQEGLIALNEAITKYKEQKNIKFSSFASVCIERKMVSLVRMASRKKHSILNDSYSLDYKKEDDSESFINLLQSNKDNVEDILISKESTMQIINKINTSLSNLEKKVYELRLNGYSYEMIAKEMGKTPKAIERTLDRIRNKLKDVINEII